MIRKRARASNIQPETEISNLKRQQQNAVNKQHACRLSELSDTFFWIRTFLDAESMLNLARAKQEWSLHLLGRHQVNVWKSLATSLLTEVFDDNKEELENIDARLQRKPINYKVVVSLILDRGCEKCLKPRIRKVAWRFGWRLCESCHQAHTISDYRLTKELHCPAPILKELPHEQASRGILSSILCTP